MFICYNVHLGPEGSDQYSTDNHLREVTEESTSQMMIGIRQLFKNINT